MSSQPYARRRPLTTDEPGAIDDRTVRAAADKRPSRGLGGLAPGSSGSQSGLEVVVEQ